MTARSNRADVRNPLLKHPGIVAEWEKLQAEHPAAAVALRNILKCSRPRSAVRKATSTGGAASTRPASLSITHNFLTKDHAVSAS